jgi:GNAT superfamily N-acetyltransferase
MLTLDDPPPASCAPAGDPDWHPAVRELGPDEIARFELHLLRLGPGCRRMRFSSPVPDDYIRSYVRGIDGTRSLILGCFINGWLRGAAELRSREADWGAEAEIAFSVERPWQGRGIGGALMEAVMATAKARGIERLSLSYHSVNHRMNALARKVAANIARADDECIANVNVAVAVEDLAAA